MVDNISNDNNTESNRFGQAPPDAHGQAAMLLVESLIHGLIARSIISVAEAVEIVGVAAEIKVEVAAEMGDTVATMKKSLAILSVMSASLSNDLESETFAE